MGRFFVVCFPDVAGWSRCPSGACAANYAVFADADLTGSHSLYQYPVGLHMRRCLLQAMLLLLLAS